MRITITLLRELLLICFMSYSSCIFGTNEHSLGLTIVSLKNKPQKTGSTPIYFLKKIKNNASTVIGFCAFIWIHSLMTVIAHELGHALTVKVLMGQKIRITIGSDTIKNDTDRMFYFYSLLPFKGGLTYRNQSTLHSSGTNIICSAAGSCFGLFYNYLIYAVFNTVKQYWNPNYQPYFNTLLHIFICSEILQFIPHQVSRNGYIWQNDGYNICKELQIEKTLPIRISNIIYPYIPYLLGGLIGYESWLIK